MKSQATSGEGEGDEDSESASKTEPSSVSAPTPSITVQKSEPSLEPNTSVKPPHSPYLHVNFTSADSGSGTPRHMSRSPCSSLGRKPSRFDVVKKQLKDEIDVIKKTRRVMSKADLAEQHQRVAHLPLPVRIVGIVFAFLGVICTWEAIDHLAVYLFPNPVFQIVAQCVLLMSGLLLLWASKKLTDFDWVDLGTFGFTLSSLMAAAAAWGLVETIMRIYIRKSVRLAAWIIGSVAMLAISLVYTLLTKHNALFDIASCASSLGYFDDPDAEEKLLFMDEQEEEYKACA